MPGITVKSAAELLRVPAYTQVRILTEQKYPKSGPQAFRTPYYSPVLNGVRSYFKSGNSKATLLEARNKILSIAQKARRENNLRVLNCFDHSDFKNRIFGIESSPRVYATIGSVELRLSPDLKLRDENSTFVVYVNCRAQAIDEEIARCTLEIGHWVMEQNGDPIPLKNFIYLDLAKNIELSFPKRRARTMTALEQNAKVIDALWPTL